MAEQNETPTPNLHFAQLGSDEDRDYDLAKSGHVSGGGGSHLGLGDGLDLNDDTINAWLWPVGLALVWLVILLVEMVFFDTDAKGLAKLPVVMGQVSSIGIMKPITAFVAHIAAMSRFLGALLYILDRLVLFVVMAISAICAGFMHISMSHWFANVIVLLVVSGVAYMLEYPLGKLVKSWLFLSAMGIGFTWIVIEFISLFMQHSSKTMTWLYQVSHSTEPIVGASVGIYGILAMVLVICLKHIRDNMINSLFFIILLVMSIALLYMQFTNLHVGQPFTNYGAGLRLGVWMHFVGYLLGIFRGAHDREAYQ